MENPDRSEQKRTTGELLKELGDEVTTLVRQEVQLAKAELSEKGKRFGAGGAMLGVAAVAGLGLLGALTATLILALAVVMHAALAALVVTVLYGVVAAVAALVGRRKVQQATPPVPEQTVESVKEDVAWAKTRIRSAKR
jgi:uncharacterized membrane protein YqjE